MRRVRPTISAIPFATTSLACCLLLLEASAPLPPWHATSDQRSSKFGLSVAFAGDIDADGFDDVIVGAYLYDAVEVNSGRAFLYLGSSSGPGDRADAIIDGDRRNAELGFSVASAGDVNADGYDDVVIGANTYNGGQPFEGKVFLHLGSASGLSTEPTWEFEDDREGGFLGQSVASAGDVNGDRFDDVIVGATGRGGRAFLFLGSPRGLEDLPAWSVEGNFLTGNLGWSVASAGDVNGDGFDDILVGEPGKLRALLFYGSTDGPSAIPDWTAETDITQGIGFGRAVASAGDINRDGYDDVIIGAAQFSTGQDTTGAAFVWLGSPSGLGATGTPDNADWAYQADGTVDKVGTSVAQAGDVNSDGIDDVVVGAQGSRFFGRVSAGAVFLFLGSPDGLDRRPAQRIFGPRFSDFGFSVAGGGDADGNGFDDVLVGAPMFVTEDSSGGAVLFFGSEDFGGLRTSVD